MFNRDHHDEELARKLGSDGVTVFLLALFLTVVSFIVAQMLFGDYVHQSIIMVGALVLGGFIGLKAFLYLKQKRAAEKARLRKLKQESIDQEREKQILAMRARERKNAKY